MNITLTKEQPEAIIHVLSFFFEDEENITPRPDLEKPLYEAYNILKNAECRKENQR